MISNLSNYGLVLSVLPEDLRRLFSTYTCDEVMWSAPDTRRGRLWFVYDLHGTLSPFRSFEVEYILWNGFVRYYGNHVSLNRTSVFFATIRSQLESVEHKVCPDELCFGLDSLEQILEIAYYWS